MLWCPCPGLQLVGTAELNNWWFLGGAYTATTYLEPSASGTLAPAEVSTRNADVVSAGPGLRLFICEKIDIGAGSAIHLTGNRWADELLRVEFRWRF